MSSHGASIGSRLAVLALVDHRVLNLAWATPFAQTLDYEELRTTIYLAFQPWAARIPDHVFDSAWKHLHAAPLLREGIAITTLKALSEEFLELRHGKLYIKQDLFADWQQALISRMSALPIQAAADALFGVGCHVPSTAIQLKPATSDWAHSSWQSHVVPLLRPENAALADYVDREGLHETHLHLNGSTHAEVCWLRAMRNPQAEVKQFAAKWHGQRNKTSLRELIGQTNPGLSPSVLYQHLHVARRLRAWLAGVAEDQIAPTTALPTSCEQLCLQPNDEWSRALPEPAPSWRQGPTVADELTWMARLFQRLIQRPHVQVERMFHTYLLLANEFHRLLVQSEDQYGFDQFQKLTFTELRDPAEEDYRARFEAMHGARAMTSTAGYVEGRFAPKSTPLQTCRLFQKILRGYLEYLREAIGNGHLAARGQHSLSALLSELDQHFEHPPARHRSIHRLTLVAHFVKESWSPIKGYKGGSFRHHALDAKLRKTTGVLLSVLARWPRLQTWVRGVDAAGNELHAPADVFAQTYRICHQAGLTRRSFHAGEDFRHLLTGIASIREALEMLDMRGGDRIGHGTAMGIRPSLWLERMPQGLLVSRGEWMLGLLSGWLLLRQEPAMLAASSKLKHELEDVAQKIFQRTLLAREVERAMALRTLGRRELMQHFSTQPDQNHEPLSELWRREIDLVQKAHECNPQALELLWSWLSDVQVQKRAEALIPARADFLDAPTYVTLQQALMRLIGERNVLIETLPSSNVRISQYQHVGEHHALRWMRAPGHAQEGDPEIMACLGSDDPGIFAADIESEFYLLYAALRQTGLSDTDALARLRTLNERGRTYRFHHPRLS